MAFTWSRDKDARIIRDRLRNASLEHLIGVQERSADDNDADNSRNVPQESSLESGDDGESRESRRGGRIGTPFSGVPINLKINYHPESGPIKTAQ